MAKRQYNWNPLAEGKMNKTVVRIVKSLFDDYLSTHAWANDIWPGSGWRTGSKEHGSGRAVDIMIVPKVNQAPTPTQRENAAKLVALLLKHGKALNIQWILFSMDDKTTWSYNFDRGSWNKLDDRGSVSANHRDHVHVYFKSSARFPAGFSWGGAGTSPGNPKPPVTGGGGPSWDGKSFPGVGAFSVGRQHPAVKHVQERLKVHGFNPGTVDGYWGANTSKATAAFQRAQGWSGSGADGIPGPKTWTALDKNPPPSSTPYRVRTNGARLNGRSGPGTNYPVTMTAANGTTLNITETKNGWAKSTGGHWYSAKYLRKV